MAYAEQGMMQNSGPYTFNTPSATILNGLPQYSHVPQAEQQHGQVSYNKPHGQSKKKGADAMVWNHSGNYGYNDAWRQGFPANLSDGNVHGQHFVNQFNPHFNGQMLPYGPQMPFPPNNGTYVGGSYVGGACPMPMDNSGYVSHWNGPVQGGGVDFNMFALCDVNYSVCCKQLFPSKTQFEVHRIQAHKNGDYKCRINYCTKTFQHNSLLQKHVEVYHNGEQKGPISCHVCFTILPHPEENEGYVKYHTLLHSSMS